MRLIRVLFLGLVAVALLSACGAEITLAVEATPRVDTTSTELVVTPSPTSTPTPTPTPLQPLILSEGAAGGAPPAGILPRLGEYYRSQPALVCSGGSPVLKRSVDGASVSPAESRVEWCACNLGGEVRAVLTLPDGAQQALSARRSLAYSSCYTWDLPLGPQALRGAYGLLVTYRDGSLADDFVLASASTPQAVWLPEENLIWAGGFQPNETLRILVYSSPEEETLASQGAFTLQYQLQNSLQADAAGELWLNPGSPQVSAAYRLVILDAPSGRAQAGRDLSPAAAQLAAAHIFNNCDRQTTILRSGQVVRSAQPLAPLYLSSLLLDDEVVDTLAQEEDITLLDGPLCDAGGWRWLVAARNEKLQGWMPESSLLP